MDTVDERLKGLKDRESREKALGGRERLVKQHKSGKLNARERLELFFDAGSFHEIDLFVRHRAVLFGMDSVAVPAEGVVTGYGTVDGRPVCAFSQDFTSMGGTLGEMHAKKICKVMDLAIKCGVPIVGFNDSGGARIQEGVDALSGYGQIFFRNSAASGVIPQLSAIMGPAAGGAVYSPAMTDWVFMTKRTSYMHITGPAVVKQATGEDITSEELGGAMTHAARSGVCHFACDSDGEAIQLMRELLSYLPSNNMEEPPGIESADSPTRAAPVLDAIIPEESDRAYDMRHVVQSIVDSGEILEPHYHYARNAITCFGRLNGRTVGVVANQPMHLAGCLDVNATDKITRFVRFCDAFNIPLLTIADVPGYLPGKDQEWSGIIRHGAKVLWAYSEATVPKITLIIRKGYGGSYLAMCSRDLGADFVFAWPTAEIAVMGAEGATPIIFRKEIDAAPDPKAREREKIQEYRDSLYNPYIAASRGYVDEVILPRDSRLKIISALELLSTKRETRPPKKHGNIPV
jgi:acetyl-CoA carboxylase carboxyltransferase component